MFVMTISREVDSTRLSGMVARSAGRICALAFLCLAAALKTQAFASGHIPPFPIEPQKFASFSACKAYLDEQHANDAAQITAAPSGDGYAKPERTLDTKGVVQTGRRKAQYDVTLGYLSRSVVDELKLIRSQYSYEERSFVCSGRKLTGTEQRGYHLETYEPLKQSD